MNRRRFITNLLGAVAVTKLVACVGDADEPGPGSGSGNDSPGVDAGVAANDSFAVTNTDSSGHGHGFEIQCGHATADGWTYTAGGAHNHTVTLTRDQLESIFAGQTVTVQTTGGHAHTWVIARPTDRC